MTTITRPCGNPRCTKTVCYPEQKFCCPKCARDAGRWRGNDAQIAAPQTLFIESDPMPKPHERRGKDNRE